MLKDGYNESVITFISQYGYSVDKRDIVMDQIKLANNQSNFNKFVLLRLYHYKSYNIEISEEQKDKIHKFLRSAVDDINICVNIQALIHLIVYYNTKLNDGQLLSLLPFSYYTVTDKSILDLHDNRFNKSFFQFIVDNISEKNSIPNKIESIIDNKLYFTPSLYCIFANYIANYNITSMFGCFEKMIDVYSDSRYGDWKVNLLREILQLGQDGLDIISSFKDKLSDNEIIEYYKILLQDENIRPDRTKIKYHLHNLFSTVSENNKTIIIHLLLLLADPKGLELFKEYSMENPDRFIYMHITFAEYGVDYIDIIKEIFEFYSVCELEQKFNSIKDTALNWLSNTALKSEKIRDNVLDYYEELSKINPEKYSYLLRVSKNLINKYYEDNSPAMPMSEIIILFNRINSIV